MKRTQGVNKKEIDIWVSFTLGSILILSFQIYSIISDVHRGNEIKLLFNMTYFKKVP